MRTKPSDIAKQLGVSPRSVQRVIASHPELGIVTVERKPTFLTAAQASQVAELVSREVAGNSGKPALDARGAAANSQEVTGSEVGDTIFAQQVAELQAQLLAAMERAARAEGRCSALEEQIADLREQRAEASEERKALQGDLASTRKLLESAETNAQRAATERDAARAEAASYKPSVFGFYRKAKVAQLPEG